jgi:hypothetical protein
MEIGFIQNCTFTAKYADFNGFTPAQRRQSTLQDGMSYVDYVTSVTRSIAPWICSYCTPGAGFPGGSAFFAPSTDAEVLNLLFLYGDRPAFPASDSLTLTGGGSSDGADYLGLIFDCKTYFAVRTIQAVNGSNLIFTQRGVAAWEFNGSGLISGPAGSEVWMLEPGAGNTGASFFSEVTSGAVVPVTTGPAANDLFPGEMWSTMPRP